MRLAIVALLSGCFNYESLSNGIHVAERHEGAPTHAQLARVVPSVDVAVDGGTVDIDGDILGGNDLSPPADLKPAIDLACQTGTSFCGGTCINTATDAQNCGGCGVVCPGGDVCMAGHCGLPNNSPCTCNPSVTANCAPQPACASNFCFCTMWSGTTCTGFARCE